MTSVKRDGCVYVITTYVAHEYQETHSYCLYPGFTLPTFISGLILASGRYLFPSTLGSTSKRGLLPTYAAMWVGMYLYVMHVKTLLQYRGRYLVACDHGTSAGGSIQRLALSITSRLTFKASKPTNPAAALLPGSLPNLVTARLMANAKVKVKVKVVVAMRPYNIYAPSNNPVGGTS